MAFSYVFVHLILLLEKSSEIFFGGNVSMGEGGKWDFDEETMKFRDAKFFRRIKVEFGWKFQ